MSVHKVLATARRVLQQLRHDHRTLGLIFLVPCVLLIILRFVFQDQRLVFNALAPLIVGIFPLTVMFIVTSIAMLRERRTGTLERLMTMPLSKLDLVFGYMLAFALLAFIQTAIVCVVMLGFLDVPVAAGAGLVLLTATAAAFLGTALGLFVSAFATSEFQAVQFMPAFIMPQLLVCGLFVPREHMAQPLQWFANIMPLTYSVDAMKQLRLHAGWTTELSHDLVIVIIFVIVALFLSALTIRRQE
jgi:ABC-2 type transport system permease protein